LSEQSESNGLLDAPRANSLTPLLIIHELYQDDTNGCQTFQFFCSETLRKTKKEREP